MSLHAPANPNSFKKDSSLINPVREMYKIKQFTLERCTESNSLPQPMKSGEGSENYTGIETTHDSIPSLMGLSYIHVEFYFKIELIIL